jgi:hypothetical protein
VHPSVGSTWDGADHIVRTNLVGRVSVADVDAWRRGLQDVIATIPDGSTFRILVNLFGFQPLDIAAHKAMRSVVPQLLAQHGMRPALLDLFDGEPELVVTCLRGVRCTACANVHHDATKMQHYHERIGASDQAFLSDLDAAEVWLASAPR